MLGSILGTSLEGTYRAENASSTLRWKFTARRQKTEALHFPALVQTTSARATLMHRLQQPCRNLISHLR